jgi:hypothetical protein
MVGTLGAVSVDVDGEANVSVTLGAATSALGTVTVYENERVNVSLDPGTSSLGSVTVISKAIVTLTGLSATGGTPKVLVWGLIDDSQDPSWGAVSDSQDPDWQEVA